MSAHFCCSLSDCSHDPGLSPIPIPTVFRARKRESTQAAEKQTLERILKDMEGSAKKKVKAPKKEEKKVLEFDDLGGETDDEGEDIELSVLCD